MRRLLILLILLAFSIVGCSSAADESDELYSGMNLEPLPGYRAVFNMTFEGENLWSYRLETQAGENEYAYELSLDGLSLMQDPGDVRLVHSEGTNRMIGEGTDNECVQFPDTTDIGVLFLTPDEIFDPNMLDAALIAFEEDEIAGQETVHYSLQQSNLLTWEEISLDLWISIDDGATLRYDLTAIGPDPLFGGGEGQLVGQFSVVEIGEQSITSINGCEIDFPLPDDHAQLIKLPGLVAFDSSMTPEELARWYQEALDEAGWSPSVDPQTSGSSIQLSYQQGEEQVQIKMVTADSGSQVEILFQIEE
jgi:hypothetical protein